MSSPDSPSQGQQEGSSPTSQASTLFSFNLLEPEEEVVFERADTVAQETEPANTMSSDNEHTVSSDMFDPTPLATCLRHNPPPQLHRRPPSRKTSQTRPRWGVLSVCQKTTGPPGQVANPSPTGQALTLLPKQNTSHQTSSALCLLALPKRGTTTARQDLLESKFTRTDNLTVFQNAVWTHQA